MGQILKKSRLKEMPKNSSLQEKRSDYVGNSSFKVRVRNLTVNLILIQLHIEQKF